MIIMNKTIIIGIGGCGCNSITRFQKYGAEGLNLVKIESDLNKKEINKLIKGYDSVIILHGIGGKIGTEVTSKILKQAYGNGPKVSLISTVPFNLEKERLLKVNFFILENGCFVNRYMLRRNDDLVKKYPKKSISEAFEIMDRATYKHIMERGFDNKKLFDLELIC